MYPPSPRLPWPVLHLFVVGLALAVGFGSVSMASEAGPSAPGGVDVNASSLSPRPPSARVEAPAPSQSLFAPSFVAETQPREVEGPQVVEAHLTPPAPCVDSADHPTFCVYTVQPGDTLSGIVQLYGLLGNEYLSAVEMLAQSNKPDVVSSDEIVPGQKLRLPKRTGIIHTALSEKPLSLIAESYGVSVESIIAVPENGIGPDGFILIGQDILIPDPQQLPPAGSPQLPPIPTATPEPELPEEEDAPETVVPPPIDTPAIEETQEPETTQEPQPTEDPQPTQEPEATEEPGPTEEPLQPTNTPEAETTRQPEPTPTPEAADDDGTGDGEVEGDDEPAIVVTPDDDDRPAEPSVYGFVWPVWGRISSYFGPGHPLGIDIDLYDDANAPVGASKAGIVTFAGGNTCCSYGLYVIVDHGDGTSTLYAHLSQIAVSKGQAVGQGQLLGFGGSTGYSTGPHLHFEVRIGEDAVDPLIFLP